MSDPDNPDPQTTPNPPALHWWRRLWPKVRVPVQLIVGQLIGWLLRKLLGE